MEKFDVVSDHNPAYYREIRSKIKRWLVENWSRWSEERPDWFNEKAIAGIPEEMLPADAINGVRLSKLSNN